MAVIHERVIQGMEVLAGHVDLDLSVEIFRKDGHMMIQFTAGKVAAIMITFDAFIRHPRSVLEPFGEELIKRVK